MDDYKKLMLLADIRRELWYEAMAARRASLATESNPRPRPWLAAWLALVLAGLGLGQHPVLGH